MRSMTPDEIHCALHRGNWASICTVGKDNTPYAIEATYFFDDDNRICFMINPKGTTLNNIGANSNVLLKMTFTSPDLSAWLGVSCFGKGEVITNLDQMTRGWELLGKVMDTDYSSAAKKFSKQNLNSPFLGVKVERMTGRCSTARNALIDFNQFTS